MTRSRLFLGAAALALAATSSVYAQDQSGDAGTVVVTGSRIKRDAFTAPDPIQVISTEQAQEAGYADTASMLQQSSLAAGSFQTNDQLTGFVVTGGPGAKTLDLRRLGAQRSIILLDGKRLGPAGVGGTVGPVDLNVIPQSSIDHIEVLKDGASSIYGSDAVAGVVNIISKKHHDGGQVSAYTSQSEHGGGDSYEANAEWGKTFDRGFIEISGEYFEQDAMTRGQRSYTRCSADYLFNPATGQRVDYAPTNTANNYGSNYKCYNLSNNDLATTAYGTWQYLQPGVTYPTAAQGNNVPGTVAPALGAPLNTIFARQARAGFPLTYPYANYSTPYTDRASVISPDRHYNVSGNLGWDFNNFTHGYAQFQYSDRLSFQTGARQLFPTLGAGWRAANPNNIFAGSGVTPVYPIIARPSDYTQDVKYTRGVLGLKGDFRGMGWFDRFSYDAFAVYSHSDASYSFDAIYNDRVVAATTGATACNPAVTNISGFDCSTLPASGIPWLSSRVVSGQFTAAESAFLFFKTHGTTSYDQYILEAGFTGNLFTLPAGDVGSAFGFSYRHDKINDTPDPQTQAGNLWGQTAAGQTSGSDAVKEVYGELNIPVIKGMPLIKSLDFDASGRYSDYDSYGSTGTFKYAMNWSVNSELRFRGSVGSSFRAPALYELYLAHQTGFLGQASVDPCVNYGSSGVSATVQSACAALGIGNAYTGVSPGGGGGSATIYTGGGKGVLKAETSVAKSIGFVLTPKHFGIDTLANLSIALDYFQFRVSNEVQTFGAYNIVYQCLNGNSAFCSLFTRDTNSSSSSYLNILTVNNNYVNVAAQDVKGLDLTLKASHNFDKWGKVSLESNLTWTVTDKTQLLGSSGVSNYNGGTFNYDAPVFAGNATIRWDYKDTSAEWYVQALGKGSDTSFIGSDQVFNTRYGGTEYYMYHTNARIYHDVSVTQRWPVWNLKATVGVRNLFDETPPQVSTGEFRVGTSALNGYDMIGRQYFFRMTKSW
jgi:iron complex outermembrane receptor protein